MFTLTIQTDNEAFGDFPHLEVARILREVALIVEGAGSGRPVRDKNGNTVGRWDLEP